MKTEQVGMFRCEPCNVEFDSMEALIRHNVEQPPGTMPDAVPADLESKEG
jgi:hypothetical protein